MTRLPERTPLVLAGFLMILSACLAAGSVKLVVPAAYLPGIPLLVRVEVWNADGERAWQLWNGQADLSVDQPGVTLSTNRMQLINGLGTALVTFAGELDFELTAAVGGESATRAIRNRASDPITMVSGPLEGQSTTWSGVVRVTGDVTVPAGHTLTLETNTLVLIDGVVSGPEAPDLLIYGKIESLGTELYPVTITSADPVLHWGQIRHETAAPSVYRWTIITRAGQAPREPHTSTGPAVRCTDSTVTFEGCTISDHVKPNGLPGKVLQATGSDLTLNDCVMARSRMGPEVEGTIFMATNCYFMEMLAAFDDEDALYIHYQGSGRRAVVSRCVIAGTSDDGLDMVGSGVTVENCIIRDIFDKGISIAQGEMHGSDLIRNCLIVNCGIGISSKGVGVVTTRIDRSTILGRDIGIGVGAGEIYYFVTNSIVAATVQTANSISTFQDPARVQIFYSNVRHTNWPGPGNIDLDPLFVDSLTNFNLRAESPCINQGDPESVLDPDGSRADMGAYLFTPSVLDSLFLTQAPEGEFRFVLVSPAGSVRWIQSSTNLLDWITTATVTNVTGSLEWTALMESLGFYRARTVAE